MRIAVLTNAYPPRAQGGAGKIAENYTEALQRLGHDIRVWGPRSEFYELRKHSFLSRLFFHFTDLSAGSSSVETIQNIVDWKPDILLTHNLTGCGFGTPKAVQASGIRWVHVLHDVQLFEPSGQMMVGESFPWLRHVWRKCCSVLRRVSLGKPDAVVSPTRWLLDLHRSFGFFAVARSEIISNPIRLASIQETIARDQCQVIFVGRMDWDKGVDLLVDAWKSMRSQGSKLVLIGAGDLLDDIRFRKDATIDIRGQQSSEEVARALRASGVVVVPSRVLENQSTVILEALAAGCRVVATGVGGNRETLGDGGWIVSPGSVDALVQGMVSALNATEDSKRDATRKAILAIHDPDAAALALTGLFKSIL